MVTDHDIRRLMQAAAERQLAVATLQKKYAGSEHPSTEQLVGDMQELLAAERDILDAIITLFVDLGHGDDTGSGSAPPPPPMPTDP